MDRYFQAQLIIWLFMISAFGVHWFFMRGYSIEKKKPRRGE
ncbi:hypothetical protein [Caulobacter vibrioides]|nr:hypothetical protein [Caulobacter vibrioides]